LVKSKNTKQIFSVYKLLTKESTDGTVSFEILKFTGNNSKELKEISLSDLADFNGAINYSTPEGIFVKDEIYDKGMLTNTFIQKPDPTLLAKEAEVSDDYVYVYEMAVTDYYNRCTLDCGGGDTFYYNGYYYYSNSVGSTYRLIRVPISTGAFYGQLFHSHNDDSAYTGPHGGAAGVDTHLEEIVIDPSVNNCVKNIIIQLSEKDKHYSVIPSINSQGLSHISSTVLNLFNSSSKYRLEFSVGQLGTNDAGNEINGSTKAIITNGITVGWQIKIDSDLVNNGTQLAIAKTVIHEGMHAYLGYILKEQKTSELYTELISYHTAKNTSNLTQHQFMSQYVEVYANSLAAWDNHKQTIDYYKLLSWGGLEKSEAYGKQTNQTQIQQAINNERYGYSNAKGTKCN
jgi:hypothetical protein